jgi:hypothetical protein
VPTWLAYLICGLIGMTVGLAELAGRYRDHPTSLFSSASSWIYFLLNGATSVVVLYLANAYGWKFGNRVAGNALISHVLIASFGAMALLRTSLFNLKVDNDIVPIGPSVILVSLLATADRGVDRRRAISRSKDAANIMKKISFTKAQAALPAFCLTLLQNATPVEQQKLGEAVKALAGNQDMTDSQKSMNLGLLLMNLVGPIGLRSAVEALGHEIEITPTSADVHQQSTSPAQTIESPGDHLPEGKVTD